MSSYGARRLVLTPNQVVSLSLAHLRREKGWSQSEACEQLAAYLGTTWSKATYSAAERSSERPDRIRQFSADDLVAFSAAFDVPILSLLLPPLHDQDKEIFITAGDPASSYAFSLGEYLQLMLGSPGGIRRQEIRQAGIVASLEQQTPGPELSRLDQSVQARAAARIRAGQRELSAWEGALTGLLGYLREAIVEEDGEPSP